MSYKVRLDYVRTAPGNQPGVFFGTENVSGSGSTPVLSQGVANMTLGGAPAPAQVRVTILAGAVVMTMPSTIPAGGESKGIRLQVGDQPLYIPIDNGQAIAFTEAADGPTNSVGSGGGSNASIGANGSAAPSSSTVIGSQDGSGNTQPASSAHPVPTQESSADASGVAMPAGGSGVRGWLSGIYKALTGTLTVQGAGTAGSPASGVQTVQGISGGAPLATYGGQSTLGPWTYNANGQSNSFNVANYGAVSVQLANTSFSGTLKLQFSNDNVNWFDGEGTTTAVSTTFGYTNGMPVHGSFPTPGYNGLYIFPVLGTYARVVTTAYTSGSIVATVQLLANQPGIRSVYSLGNPMDQNPVNLGNPTMVGGQSAANGSQGQVTTWNACFAVPNYVNGYTDSTTTLGSSATFTGTARSLAATNGGAVANYFNAQSYADQAGTLQIQQSCDNGATWQTVASTAAAASTVATARAAITGAQNANTQYRVQYVNGSTAQGTFRLLSSMTAN